MLLKEQRLLDLHQVQATRFLLLKLQCSQLLDESV